MTLYIGHLPYEIIVTINYPLIIMVEYLGKITQKCNTIELLVSIIIHSQL